MGRLSGCEPLEDSFHFGRRRGEGSSRGRQQHRVARMKLSALIGNHLLVGLAFAQAETKVGRNGGGLTQIAVGD